MTRRFVSYGPVDNNLHFYAPRKELIHEAYLHLLGEHPDSSGHYVTVWAPRQTGKSWIMQQILFLLRQDDRFDVLKLNLENLKDQTDPKKVLSHIAQRIGESLGLSFPTVDTQSKFQDIFKRGVLEKPLILILDEFDALSNRAIDAVVSTLRNIYITRLDEMDKPPEQKSFLLHGLALVGIRSVLGIDSHKGSPFNVQRGLHIPNLTFQEVQGMFQWYERESGQTIEPEVIEKVFGETNGQPGLTCWFGELLTDKYNDNKDRPVTLERFEHIREAAVNVLPNSNILNIIHKADVEPHRNVVLDMFKTDELSRFKFDDKSDNYLYMNGVIEPVDMEGKFVVRFANPFVQKRLFNYFSNELFKDMGQLVEPMDDLADAFSEEGLDVSKVIERYQRYLDRNRHWLFKEAPRRKDLRLYEAVFHFNIYMFLFNLVERHGGRVFPEFPTGNGKIDIIIKYKEKTYGIELKSFAASSAYASSLKQSAHYGKRLGLKEIHLALFIESINEENRAKYEAPYTDEDSGVKVLPMFIQTGE
jgi:hypothetical protein